MLIVTDDAFPGEGVMTCAACRIPMPTGTPYTQQLTGMVGETPLVEIVCVDCGTAARPDPASSGQRPEDGMR